MRCYIQRRTKVTWCSWLCSKVTLRSHKCVWVSKYSYSYQQMLTTMGWRYFGPLFFKGNASGNKYLEVLPFQQDKSPIHHTPVSTSNSIHIFWNGLVNEKQSRGPLIPPISPILILGYRCLAGRMAMRACQIGPTDTAPPCPGSPQQACVETDFGLWG